MMMVGQAKVQLLKEKKRVRGGREEAAYWVLRWRGSGGKWVREPLGRANGPERITKSRAEDCRHDKQRQLNQGLCPVDPLKPITLAEWVTLDCELQRKVKRPSTVRENEIAGLQAKRALGGGEDEESAKRGGAVKLKAITTVHVEHIRAWMLDRGVSQATVAKTLRHLRGMFNRAVKHGHLIHNPFSGVDMPKVQGRAKRVFTDEELSAMREACPDVWWEAFVMLGATSGLRFSEMLNTLWRDIDFEGGTITVSGKRGKMQRDAAGRPFPILEWSAKNGRGRSVPLPPETVNVLTRLYASSDGSHYVFLTRDRLAAIAATPIKRGEKDGPKIECGPVPANFRLVNNLPRGFQAIQTAAKALVAERRGGGVESVKWPQGTIHDLRRTFATRMVRNGVPIHALKEYMGHAKISTTQEHYLAVEAAEADRARAAWRGAFSDGESGTESGMAPEASDNSDTKNNKTPAFAGARVSEADGTRTRNHRIDSPVL